jgi:hypothetical protein
MAFTLRLAHPLEADDAERLGLIPRAYALNEIITVDLQQADSLLNSGYATTNLVGPPPTIPPLDPGIIAAVQAWLAANPPTAAPATSTTRGTIKLGGHIAGTADNPTIPELADKASTDDPRLSDEREPLPHRETHAYGGTDVITPQDIGAVSTEFIGQPNGVAGLDGGGHVPMLQLPTVVQGVGTKVETTDPRLSDARAPINHHTAHEVGGADPVDPLKIGALTQQRADDRYMRSLNGITPDNDGNVSIDVGQAAGTVMSIVWGGSWPPRASVSTDPNGVVLWIGPSATPPAVGGPGMGANDVFVGR